MKWSTMLQLEVKTSTVAFRSFFNVIELMELLIRGGQVDLSILLNGVGER